MTAARGGWRARGAAPPWEVQGSGASWTNDDQTALIGSTSAAVAGAGRCTTTSKSTSIWSGVIPSAITRTLAGQLWPVWLAGVDTSAADNVILAPGLRVRSVGMQDSSTWCSMTTLDPVGVQVHAGSSASPVHVRGPEALSTST